MAICHGAGVLASVSAAFCSFLGYSRPTGEHHGAQRIQESLQESEDRLRRILEQSPMSMAIVRLEGVVEYINKKSVLTFGYRHEEIPTMDHWWTLAYPDEAYRLLFRRMEPTSQRNGSRNCIP